MVELSTIRKGEERLSQITQMELLEEANDKIDELPVGNKLQN